MCCHLAYKPYSQEFWVLRHYIGLHATHAHIEIYRRLLLGVSSAEVILLFFPDQSIGVYTAVGESLVRTIRKEAQRQAKHLPQKTLTSNR
jgi:hypothetical protein